MENKVFLDDDVSKAKAKARQQHLELLHKHLEEQQQQNLDDESSSVTAPDFSDQALEDDDEVAKAKAKAQQEMELLQKQLEQQQLDAAPDFTSSYMRRTSSSSSSSTVSSSSKSKARKRSHRMIPSMLKALMKGVGLPCLSLVPFPAAAAASSSSRASRRRRSSTSMTGTLFGYRKSHVHFSVQEDPRSPPLLVLELTTPTSVLVREMASGLVRIALECEKQASAAAAAAADDAESTTGSSSSSSSSSRALLSEPEWTMYCNGQRSGYALRKEAGDEELQVLGMIQQVSMGAGVLPMDQDAPDGELMYMRARYERVIGSKDSEAFYMLNPDRTGGPELSIFLLRV